MLRLTAALPAALALLVAVSARGDDEYAPGEKLTLSNCGRCHVINERNRYGSIGSTPSFAALRNASDWENRFRAFYTLNPHRAFTQIPGVTEPFPIDRPSPIHPIELTLEEIEKIVEFSRTIEPKDLGAPIR